MSDQAHPPVNYVTIWVILAVALVASLALGILAPSPWVVGIIFAIAAVKAYLVAAYYMHLRVEPMYVKVMVGGLVLLLLILYAGLVPDIVWFYGAPESP